MAGTGRPGPECGIATLLRELDDDGRQMVTDLLDDDESWWDHGNRFGLTDQAAADAFNELAERAGLDVPRMKRQVVGYHRRDTCRCGDA